MQTDLRKILSVSGQHDLFRYLAQARNGIVAENITNGKRTSFSHTTRLSTLADIAIYTDEKEMKLSEVFLAINKALDGAEAPSHKASEAEIKALFIKAVPNYDEDRFYLSHMRKVLDWYSQLVKHASLDFVEEEEEEPQETEA